LSAGGRWIYSGGRGFLLFATETESGHQTDYGD
jgi:hypothetical protein